LQVTTDGASIAEADVCVTAKMLEVGFSELVDLSQATADPDLESCTGIPYEMIGNFYAFVGTGKSAQVLVSWNLTYAGIIYIVLYPGAVVLEGSSCGDLACIVSSSHDACEFPTTLGQSYYVYVYFSGETNAIEDSDRYLLKDFANLTIVDGSSNKTDGLSR
jgi:hypothetical protein